MARPNGQVRRTRADIADAANRGAAQSRYRGAPPLQWNSSRETVTRWLQWNDPNGAHTDALAEAEDIDPYDLDSAWEALEQMVQDYL